MNGNIGSGIITPLVTPIHEDESIHPQQLRALVEHVMKGGVDAVFVMSSTGEFARFSPEARFQAIRATVEYADGLVPVYAGVGDTGLAAVKRNLSLAEQAGADVAVVTLPYYYPTRSDREALDFFGQVAAHTRLPVMLYNVPGTCGVNISLKVMDQLLSCRNVAGIIDASGDPSRLEALLERYTGNGNRPFAVVVETEELCCEGLSWGADGLSPSLSNPFPRLFADIMRAAGSNNAKRLWELCDLVERMNKINLYSDAWMSPNVWRKRALSHMGVCGDLCTAPYVPVDPATDQRVLEFVRLYREMYP